MWVIDVVPASVKYLLRARCGLRSEQIIYRMKGEDFVYRKHRALNSSWIELEVHAVGKRDASVIVLI